MHTPPRHTTRLRPSKKALYDRMRLLGPSCFDVSLIQSQEKCHSLLLKKSISPSYGPSPISSQRWSTTLRHVCPPPLHLPHPRAYENTASSKVQHIRHLLLRVRLRSRSMARHPRASAISPLPSQPSILTRFRHRPAALMTSTAQQVE
jgi:hypothetical protein